MEMLQNFEPLGTAMVTADTNGETVQFTTQTDIQGNSVMISNEGMNTVLVQIGTAGNLPAVAIPDGTPAQNRTPVLPGAIVLLRKPGQDSTVILYTKTGTSICYVTAGNGN